jgi:hypothetical protein
VSRLRSIDTMNCCSLLILAKLALETSPEIF